MTSPSHPAAEVEPVEDGIGHLSRCPGCDECDWLMQFYETCDECGAWGHMDAMQGYVLDGRATVLCSRCFEQWKNGKKRKP